MPPISRKRILFIHPDLGIGGAERLVVDAAVGLQERGHEVTVYTSHCDPRHCFDEARNGTLKVRVAGNTLIPPNLFGRFSILCAILRQLHLALTLILSRELHQYDCVFIDQLSVAIPVLRLFAPQITVLFYCHFPDYLLATRSSLIKSLYRIPFDWLEAATTGLADIIVVNSMFTKSVFARAFPRIRREPTVIYPCVDVSPPKESPESTVKQDSDLFPHTNRKVLLSINRFERKKNIALAIQSYALLSPQERSQARLVIAGGYDNRVAENLSYHNELVSLCESLGLEHTTFKNFITALSVPDGIDVLFLLSIPSRLKSSLLCTSSLLLYTPENEHFGIVPLEALFSELPVLAHRSGGPLETIREGGTGWLRPTDPAEWAGVIRKALFELSPDQRKEMGAKGKKSVVEGFSKEKMAERLEREFDRPVQRGRGHGVFVAAASVVALAMGLGLAVLRVWAK